MATKMYATNTERLEEE